MKLALRPEIAALFLVSLGGCSRIPAELRAPEPLVEVETAEVPALVGESGARPVRETPRRVGDVFVHRFSGKYRGEAFVLVEEVVGQSADELIVDYRVTEGDEPRHLRVRMAKASERVLRVSRVVDGVEEPEELAAYDALLAMTSFTPDRNDGLEKSRVETCLIGTDEDTCRVNEYLVDVGGAPARLAVTRSQRLGRDVSGEIVAVDGTVLYKADLLEARRGPVAADHETTTASLEVPDWAR